MAGEKRERKSGGRIVRPSVPRMCAIGGKALASPTGGLSKAASTPGGGGATLNGFSEIPRVLRLSQVCF